MILVFLACSENNYQYLPKDTGAGLDSEPIDSGTPPEDTEAPEDSAAPCPLLVVGWEAPMLYDSLTIDGELSANGFVYSAWTERIRLDGAVYVEWEMEACTPPTFRGQGAGWIGTPPVAFSCQNDGTSDEWPYEQIGEFSCSYDGIPGVPEIT